MSTSGVSASAEKPAQDTGDIHCAFHNFVQVVVTLQAISTEDIGLGVERVTR